MRKFLLRISAFFLPLILLWMIPHFLLYQANENYHNLDHFIQDTTTAYLYGYAYNEANYNYLKYKSTVEKGPVEVLALGSSRVLQFREEMFTGSFYNAGFTIRSVADFEVFLRALPEEKHPHRLLIALDQWMFNPAWEDPSAPKKSPEHWSRNHSTDLFPAFKNTKSLFDDWKEGKIPLPLPSPTGNYFPIGLNALLNQKGFRNDGSMYYGGQIEKLRNGDPTAQDFNFRETFDRIADGNRRFEYGDQVNPEIKALKDLKNLLFYCRERNIEVIGFLPPFANAVWEKMMDSKKYNYMPLINPPVEALFAAHDFEFYSFHTLAHLGATNSEALDGFHGGERMYLRMLIHMLEMGSQLNEACDLPTLQNELKKGTGLEVYGE